VELIKNKNYFDQRILTFYLTTAITMTGIVLFGFLSYQKFQEVEATWLSSNQYSTDAYNALTRFNNASGYGGFIHNFKNLVLRRDLKTYGPRIEQNISQINDSLSLLNALFKKPDEKEAIQNIKNTFSVYFNKYETIKKKLKKGAYSGDLDVIGRVSDVKALQAKQYLISHIKINTLEATQKAQSVQVEAFQFLMLSGVIMLLFIIVNSFLLIRLLKRIFKADHLLYLSQKKLRKSETQFRELFESSPIGIALINPENGCFVKVNKAFLQALQYSETELLELTVEQLTPKKYRVSDQKSLLELKETETFLPYEKEYFRADGSLLSVRQQGFTIKNEKNEKRVWTFIEDISDEKANAQLKNSFISTVSHELRTPLTSISGAIELLNSGVLGDVPDAMQDMLRVAGSNSVRLTNLVNDLLDLDKLIAGQMQMDIELVSLNDLIAASILDMAGYTQKYNVTMEFSLEENLQVMADSNRLKQVLINLLSNACKHSLSGGVVNIEVENIAKDYLIVSVIDHGQGVPKNFRGKIFEKFSQADGSDTRSEQGTGLGLAICKELITKMDGQIGYESTEGKGSRFWFRIPKIEGVDKNTDHKKLQILHVEDDLNMQNLISAQLSDIADIHSAKNLQEAHIIIRHYQLDLVLLDIYLPDGNGEDLLDTIVHAQAHLPVIALSEFDLSKDITIKVAAVLPKKNLTKEILESTIEIFFPKRNLKKGQSDA